MHSALGAQKWLNISEFADSTSCLEGLKQQGYRIASSELHSNAKSVYEVDWTKQKTVILLGNEVSKITVVNLQCSCDMRIILTTSSRTLPHTPTCRHHT